MTRNVGYEMKSAEYSQICREEEMTSSELNYLLHACKDIYKPPQTEPKKYNIKKAIKIANDNGLLYQLIKSNSGIYEDIDQNLKLAVNKLLNHHQQYFCRLKKSISEINRILGPDNCLIIKTIYNYPHTTKDVDIVVKDLSGSLDSFLENGHQHTFREPPYKQTVRKDGLLHITLHKCVAWGKVVPISLDFLWENSQKTKFHGLAVQLPSVEVDLLTLIAHIPFELLYFKLGDLLYIFKLSEQADWKKILKQAKTNNWINTLKNVVSIMNGLHRSLYNEPSPIENEIPGYVIKKPKFPLSCPFAVILRAHIEKRAWEKIFSVQQYIKQRLK